MVARWAHNSEVAGSNPARATHYPDPMIGTIKRHVVGAFVGLWYGFIDGVRDPKVTAAVAVTIAGIIATAAL